MLQPMELRAIADTCLRISNEVATTSGFVPIRRLLERFDVSLVLRPLLVEGMLASIPSAPGSFSASKLAVLVDSESFELDDKAVSLEKEEDPLPARFRNTVAHELVHSLAFRPSMFGIQLQRSVNTDEKIADFVKQVERETERFSPLLLWSEKALNSLIESRDQAITPGELAVLAGKLGISRSVAISRLRLRRLQEGIFSAPWLRNVGIGIGTWTEGRRAIFRKWPLFASFDRNIAPHLIHRVSQQDRLPVAEVIGEEHGLVLTGGEYTRIRLRVPAGTADAPNTHQMPVMLSVEGGTPVPGAEFIYVIRTATENDDTPPEE